MSYTVAAFYRFTPLPDAAACVTVYEQTLAPLGLCGTLLVAPEGINGTLAGSPDAIEQMLSFLRAQTGLQRAAVKFSSAPDKPFNRLKIRLKREIITFNQPTADPALLPGTYVAPKDWNRLLDDPTLYVLDTRNRYETAIGTFAHAVDPQIDRFTDFAGYVRAKLDPAQHRTIAMYCTGGHQVREGSSVHARGRVRRGLSSAGRYSAVSGGDSRSREPVAGRLLRFRQARRCGARLDAGSIQHVFLLWLFAFAGSVLRVLPRRDRSSGSSPLPSAPTPGGGGG